jgi:hypothetical protein
MAHFITSRPANPNIGSSAAFAKAKTWLAECVDGHTKCQQISPESTVMPTRVLEIFLGKGDKYFIRLHESGGEIGFYEPGRISLCSSGYFSGYRKPNSPTLLKIT